MPPLPKPEFLGDHPDDRPTLSSCRTYDGTLEPLSVDGPINQLNQPVATSLESLSPAFPLNLLFDFERDRVLSDDLSLLPLLASGGSIKDTRLGVDRPDPPMPIASDTLNQLLLNDNAGEVGVGGADLPLLPFRAE